MSNLALKYHQEERPSIKQAAAEGSFRAIALWLNEYLVPQQIFAQVDSNSPGCLQVIVEFHKPPHRDRLVRFICHRLWHLNSELIEGAHIIARTIGQTRPLWQEKIRISTSASRQNRPQTTVKTPSQQDLPPQIVRRQKTSSPSPYTAVLNRHIKVVRAFVLSGSAVAAFLFGCFAEVMVSKTGPALPLFSQPASPLVESRQPNEQPDVLPVSDTFSDPGAAPISQVFTPESDAFREARSNIVNAPLEPVAVIQHERVMYPADPNVTLLFGGEVDLDNLPYESVENDAEILGTLADYQQADIAMVGLGDPLTAAGTQPKEELYNHQRPDAVHVLKDAGIDMVNLSSGNLLGFGEYGLQETLTTLDREGLYRVGAGLDGQEARRPEILDVKGQRIAYLAYNQDDLHEAYKDAAGINAQGKRQIIEDIRTLRNQVDWIVVNYRWQTETPQSPADWQTNLARMAIDQGADVVVGYHPAQIQGAEIYKGRPIAYSLGDFVFGDIGRDRETAMLKISVRPGQMKVDLLPVIIHNNQPELATGDTAEAILQKIQTASLDFDQPMQASEVLDVRSQHQSQPQNIDQPTDGGFTSPGHSLPDTNLLDLSPVDATAPTLSPGATPVVQPSRNFVDETPAITPESTVAPNSDTEQQEAKETAPQMTSPNPSFIDQQGPTPIQVPADTHEPAGQDAVPIDKPQPTLIPDPSVRRINHPAPSVDTSSEQVPFEAELEIQLEISPSELLQERDPNNASAEAFESVPETPMSLPLPETMPGLTLDNGTPTPGFPEHPTATQSAPVATPSSTPAVTPADRATDEETEADKELKAQPEVPEEGLAVPVEPEAEPQDAIGPYNEPLVGPLSSADTEIDVTSAPQSIALSVAANAP